MSIIDDALKRDQEAQAERQQEKTEKKTHKSRRTLIIGIVFIASIVFFGIKFNILKNIPLNFFKKKAPNPSQPDKRYKAGNYVLEGVIKREERPLAIINGKVLGLGDLIDTFQIFEINADTVKILDTEDNTVTTLTF
jgi:hypothetical protein